jgi:uncharacterized membrane protein
MNRSAQNMARAVKIDPAPTAQSSKLAGGFIHGIFFATFGLVWLKTALPFPAIENTGWPEALIVLAATASVIRSASRQLPLQNVLLASTIIGCIGGCAQVLGTLKGIPFGPFGYTNAAGPRILGILPWPIPLVWIVVMLVSRDMARLILRPWRKMRAYGFWLIGLTAVLAVTLDLGLEPFARVKHYWLWQTTRFPFDWHGIPLTNFIGWLVTALLILAFATPALINKRPGNTPLSYYPLIVWPLLNTLFATNAVTHRLWLAAGFSIVATSITTLLAVRGAKW